MARDLSASVQAALDETQVNPILLFEAEFADGYLRLWTGYGDLSWNGYTWTGAGTMGSISPISETDQVQANGIAVSLSGIPSAYVSLILSDVRQGKVGRVYLGFLDNSGNIIANPYMAFEGRLDIPTIEEAGEGAMITITYESRLIDLNRSREIRFTDEEQKRMYLGDKGLEYVVGMQEVTLNWGRGTASTTTAPSTSGTPTIKLNGTLKPLA